VEQYYPRLEEFTFELIDCHEWDYNSKKLAPKGDLVDLLSSTASRVILMDVKEVNRLLNSHVYCASLMQMIEESVYDFSGLDKSKSA
jgi:hypothetical protein